jgi:hypothetical protein
MSGGSKTVTTSASGSSEPWAKAQPYLEKAMTAAGNEFDAGTGSQVYQGTTVVPFANQTIAGMNQIEGLASNAAAPMQNPMTAYSGMMQTLNPIAQGDFSNDTTFNNTLGRAQQDARTGVDLSMSGAGRYGGAMHQGNIAREIGDLTNRAMLQRQDWASQQMQNYGNAMPQAFQTAMMPAQAMMGVGSAYEGLAGNYLQEQADRFDAQRNAKWDDIARLNAIAHGAGQLGGSKTEVKTSPNPNYSSPAQIFGGGLSLLASIL